jgi:hypothetical protein
MLLAEAGQAGFDCGQQAAICGMKLTRTILCCARLTHTPEQSDIAHAMLGATAAHSDDITGKC